ncbi:hypothetical protein C7M61_002970 [Candidozyma pseudohaemuli]|uniref:Uncharacterized protein n=1 Tax=Candidozyma pseudohaemuli TaxID=418784 RepID=A0A2P7YR11_9ASCO|nr:hypothetical protein C7M61_002970 [[Candida] pseudohaemulonii]PSK38407.1 hypothetical protein C7M61_002970 [[Candida] pseudohaemulonii]
MSSSEATPEVEVAAWKPLFDLDTPAGRVCMLSEKEIDREFNKRYNIYKENLGSYSRTLERYYGLKTHEKYGTLPFEVIQETSRVSNYRVTNKEFIAMGMEIIASKIVPLTEELQHLEEQCFNPPKNKQEDALRWIYEYIYQREPPASTVEIIARTLQSNDYQLSKLCPHLCDMGKSDLIAYFVSKSVQHDKDLNEKRDEIIRQAAHRRSLAQEHAMNMAKGDGPIYKVDIPLSHYLPECDLKLDSSTIRFAKLKVKPPTSGPQATRAPNTYTMGQLKSACDDYFTSGVNKTGKIWKRSKRGGRSKRSW